MNENISKKESLHKKEVLYKKDFSSKDKEKREFIYFKCKKPRHIKYKYPFYKSELMRRNKKIMLPT